MLPAYSLRQLYCALPFLVFSNLVFFHMGHGSNIVNTIQLSFLSSNFKYMTVGSHR